jgi:16S rRNA (guanine527-N7)-methyltransferase
MTPPQDLLARYAALIRSWAPRLDLVSPGDLERLEERHIEDSLRVVPLLDELPPGLCVDIGSGAGFPGIPLAIARPDRRWTLIEPRKLRAAFLDEVVRELEIDCEVVRATAEQCADRAGYRERYVLATARAVADPVDIRSLADPFLVPGGIALVFTGEQYEYVGRRPPEAVEWRPGLTIMKKPLEAEPEEGTE